jgi:TDG/mug DNA glycosylase family protein
MDTLPDYLREGLDIVFVGINPGAYSAQVGHYFATPQNRFWKAVNRSGLVPGHDDLGPEDDASMPGYGIGFTDVVKRASNSAGSLRVADYRRWAPETKEKLLRYAPAIVCFNGLMGYRNYVRYADGVQTELALGRQQERIGSSLIFVAPNPSPANAVYSLEDIARWYGELGRLRDEIRGGP